jgi:hypothetical protein
VQFSSDTGKTWTVATYENFPSQYQRGECVAISTDGEVTLWAPSHKTVGGSDVAGDYPVQRYANSSWTEVKDIDGAYVAGDPEDAQVFYAFRKSEGAFYKSIDKGITFIKAGVPGVSDWRKFRLAPGKKGDIWIPLGKNGLSRSIDGAATFAAISNVTNCEAVGFGKAAQGKSFPAVYIFGTIAAVTGVFQSVDEGVTWVRINDDAHEYGGLANGEFVVGDMNMFGVVYRSTAGRGIACRLPSTMAGMNENAASSKSAKQASCRMDRGVLHVSPHAGDPQTVTLYSLTGRRLFHQSYHCPVNISINRVLQAKGVRVLMIGSRGTVASTKIISVKP